MLYDNPFPRGAIALAVLAAMAAPARGEDFAAESGNIEAGQTYFPAAGAIDTERSNSTSILNRIRADAAYLRGITGRGVTIGVTPGTRSSDSLVTEISKARTNAFSFALVAADRVRPGDRLSVSLSQPMRTYSGRIVMDVLSRSSGSGAARERLMFSMVPIGRDMRAQLNYQMPAGYGTTFGLTLMVRRNPNNLVDAAVETLIAARYVKAF